MQPGQYIIDRLMVAMLQDICLERGIHFRTFSDKWIVELEKNGEFARAIGYQFSLNSAAASNIAQDKVAAYQILTARGLVAVPHFLLRTKAGDAQWKVVDWSAGVVVKPLLGTGGHGVALYANEKEAYQAIHESGIEAWAASPFQDALKEVRITLLDGVMLLAYEKQPLPTDGLKLFNLSQGAIPVDYIPPEQVVQMAKDAQKALSLRLCAVDILQLTSGEWRILEVNSGFMMEYYARYSEENKARTREIYEHIVDALFA